MIIDDNENSHSTNTKPHHSNFFDPSFMNELSSLSHPKSNSKDKQKHRKSIEFKHDPESDSEHSFFEGIGKQETLGDFEDELSK